MNGAGANAYMSEDEYDDYPPPSKSSSSSGGPGSYYGPGPSGAGGSGTCGQIGSGYIPSGGSSAPASRNQICCLIDDTRRCPRPAGNASYSKRIQKTVYYKRLKLEIDPNANHIYICDHHKMVIQNARTRQKQGSDDEINETEDAPEVDLYQLQVNTLRRYKKHFKISSRPSLNKAQLADILMRHFKTIPVAEKETITYFIYMVKSEKSKLDNRNGQDANGGNNSTATSEYPDRY
ncbi:Histone deacetylase complex subunit SAP30 [Orchesella cincta]|uniref:Histone deacetylase complex subunit SAP30 n=1 Tax=Orchesella cincta TaxID=48709 RepID=A0A1D2N1C0_ORCCI|nr:Histone deacetylase complex subunit SAP30 [Orchesella cincta]